MILQSRKRYVLKILNNTILSNLKMQALHDVVKAGYVRYIGMSSCWAWQCEQSDFIYVLSITRHF